MRAFCLRKVDFHHIFGHSYRKKSIDINTKYSDYDSTGFHMACERGHSYVIKTILENAHSLNLDLNVKDCFSLTGFHHACKNGHSDVVQIFMENAAALNNDLNIMDINGGSTGFHYACERGHSDVVKIFMENASILNLNLNAISKYGNQNTGFHWACLSGHKNIVELMLNNSKNLDLDLKSINYLGYTGLQKTKIYRRSSVVKLIKFKMPNIAC